MSASLLQCVWRLSTSNFIKPGSVIKNWSANYAKKVAAASQMKKPDLAVEEDPEKLLKFCCGANIYKDGTDPELKPHSEYPEWLWELRLDPDPVPLEELDKESLAYWRRLRRITLTNRGKLDRVKKRKTMRFTRR